jgi:hypothetical protein
MIDWKAFSSAAEVTRQMENLFRLGATPFGVLSLAQQEGLECSELINGALIRCSAPAASKVPFVRAKWIMEFHFEKHVLTRITVTQGLIGP